MAAEITQLPPCATTRRPRCVPTVNPIAYAIPGPDVAGNPLFNFVGVVMTWMMSPAYGGDFIVVEPAAGVLDRRMDPARPLDSAVVVGTNDAESRSRSP